MPEAAPQVKFDVTMAMERGGEGELQGARAGIATTTLGTRAT